MVKKMESRIHGWNILFEGNVHMYCHRLLARKGKHEINIQCEDLAIEEKTVGIWLFDLDVSDDIENELQQVVIQWANSIEERIKIYKNQNEFVYNKFCA